MPAVVVFLFVCGLLELLAGLAILVGAKSAIHEILGTLAAGFAIMTWGLAAILGELKKR